jgi:hypothetical protein
MTDYQAKRLIIEYFMNEVAKKNASVSVHLKKEDVMKILDKDYAGDTDALNTDLAALKDIVVAQIMADATIDEDRKAGIQSEMRSVIDVLKLLKETMDAQEKSDLSEAGVAGVLGRVLNETDMDNVFTGDFSSVIALQDASVRLVYADGEETFYHENGKDDIPQAIKDMSSDTMPRHVLMVHYRTDDDVKMLLEDLSHGEELHASFRDDPSQQIVMEGRSDSPEVIIKKKPDSVDEADLLANPMKYLGHDVNVQKK